MNKLLVKIFGLIIKILGKKASKENLKAQIISALDTDGNGSLSLNDWANGKWKDIDWIKLTFALVVLSASLYLGYIAFPELIDYLLSN